MTQKKNKVTNETESRPLKIVYLVFSKMFDILKSPFVENENGAL